MKKLREVCDPLSSNVGIFKELYKINSNLEWLTLDQADILDLDYYLGFSANKSISPLYDRLLYSFKDLALNKIANIIYNRFKDNWDKTYKAYVKIYEPLENYSMEEVETPNLVESRTSSRNENIDRNVDSKSTNTSNRNVENKQSINVQNKGNTDSSIYGFNSVKAVPSNTGNANNTTIADLESNKNINTDNSNDNSTDLVNETNKVTGTTTDEVTSTGNRKLTRKGNIGVTTSQQMLESEINLRKYDFYKRVMMDIDSVMCLKSY